MVKPKAKRDQVSFIRSRFGLNERQACRYLELSRSTLRYQAKPDKDHFIRTRLHELANERRRNGCPMFHSILKREGLVINHKRTERIYKEEGLSIKRKSRRRRKAKFIRNVRVEAEYPNHIWALDFVHDKVWFGRKFRTLNIIDEYTREIIGMVVDTSINGCRVGRELSQLITERGKPKAIRSDNGPEFTSRAMDEWSSVNGVELIFIEPGKPVQNTLIESCNARFREECLNANWFTSLKEARETIMKWRKDFNEVRPHSSLNNLTPREFYELNTLKKVC